MVNEYWFNTLGVSDKSIYKNMVANFSRMKFDVDCGNVNPQALVKVYGAVMDDHPELFYLTYKPGASQKSGFFGSTIVFQSSSIFSSLEISRYKSAIDGILKKIKTATSVLKTEAEKEKFIVDHFIENVEYKIDVTFNQNAATCLVDGKAQCSGIARAIKYVCDYVGLWCIVVGGQLNDRATGTVGPHAWNIIRVDGKYYHLDVTQMLGVNASRVKPFRYTYYNYTDEEIKVNHLWTGNTPACTQNFGGESSSNGNAGNAGIGNVYGSLYEVRVNLADALKKKQTEFSFRSKINCENDNELMKVLNLAVGSAIKASPNKVSQAAISVQGGFVTISIKY